MKKTVYITTAGDYSDYHIDRVFSTREKAQAWRDKFKALPIDALYRDDPPGAIEEFIIDEADEFVLRLAWCADIKLRTGDITTARACEIVAAGPHERGVCKIHDGALRAQAYSFESIDHAIKLAAESRQKWLRENGE